jgi:hypothetical protein
MLVTDLRLDRTVRGARISALYSWEDSARPEETVAFEVEGARAVLADPAPESFALLGALAAFHHGERRVRVQGSLCPRFRDGVRTALRTLCAWYPARRPGPEPELEAEGGFTALRPPAPRAALFLSGGVDSLFALTRNRESFPRAHPAAYRDAILVVGFGTQGGNGADERFVNIRERQRSAVESIAEIAGLDLLVVRSNVEVLGEDNDFFLTASHGAHLVAVAHLFPRLLSSISVSASQDAFEPKSWGSHPLLDNAYASSAIGVRHEGFDFRREERLAAVARWKEVLPYLMVCTQGPLAGAERNCGRCEKCLRTMIALYLAGALGPPAPFPHDIDPSWLASIRTRPTKRIFWRQFPESLRARGREDLAAGVERLLSELDRLDDWFGDRGWKGKLRQARRRILRLLERAPGPRRENGRGEPA